MEARGIVRRAARDLPNFISLLVFFSATAIIFRSIEFALIVTASLGFHELGHAAALAWYGVEWHISFGVVGAWTWSPLSARERLSQLANALIHLSGPLFSVLLALAALGLQAAWQPADKHLQILASFSAQVGFLNLLPFGGFTDGGKIIRRMIASIDRKSQIRVALLPVFITLLMITGYGLIEAPHLKGSESTPFLLGLCLIGLWMANSVLIEKRRAASSEDLSVTGNPMTSGEVYFLVIVIWDLLALGLIITAVTPFWLTPEYVLGSLKNIEAVLHLFQIF